MLSFPVAPAVRPTVASADTDSYIASVNPTGDVALMKIPPKTPRKIMIKAMVMASSTWLAGMVRL